MKTISLWQPWATLWMLGHKQWETRSWTTPYRGPLAIHAAKRKIDEEDLFLLEMFGLTREDCPLGAVLGYGRLARTLDTTSAMNQGLISATEFKLGDYGAGRYCWELVERVALKEPAPFKGSQGFFEWDDLTGAKAEALARRLAV